MSHRRNWDSPNPTPLSPASVPLLSEPGGAHSPAGEGLGESQFRQLEKILALCLLYGKTRRNRIPLPRDFFLDEGKSRQRGLDQKLYSSPRNPDLRGQQFYLGPTPSHPAITVSVAFYLCSL